MIPVIENEQIYGYRPPSGRITMCSGYSTYLHSAMQRMARRGYVFTLVPRWMCYLSIRHHQTRASARLVVCAVRPQVEPYYDLFMRNLGSRGSYGLRYITTHTQGRVHAQRKMFGHHLFAWTWYVDQARRRNLGWDGARLVSQPTQVRDNRWRWRTTRNLDQYIRDYTRQLRECARNREGLDRAEARAARELARCREERRNQRRQPTLLTPEVLAAVEALPGVHRVSLEPEGLQVDYYPTICRCVNERRQRHEDCNFDVLIPGVSFWWQSGQPMPYDLTRTNCHPHHGCYGDYNRGLERAYQAEDLLGSVLTIAQWRQTHGAGSYTTPPVSCVRNWFNDVRPSSPSVFEIEDNGVLRTLDIRWMMPRPLWFPTMCLYGAHIEATRPGRMIVEDPLARLGNSSHLLLSELLTPSHMDQFFNRMFTPWALGSRRDRTRANRMRDGASAAAHRAARQVAPITAAEHRRVHHARYWHTHDRMRSEAAADYDWDFHGEWWLSCGRALSTVDWANMRADVNGQPRPEPEAPSPPPPGRRAPVETNLRWPFGYEIPHHNQLHVANVPHLHGRVLEHTPEQVNRHTIWGGPTADEWSQVPIRLGSASTFRATVTATLDGAPEPSLGRTGLGETPDEGRTQHQEEQEHPSGDDPDWDEREEEL